VNSHLSVRAGAPCHRGSDLGGLTAVRLALASVGPRNATLSPNIGTRSTHRSRTSVLGVLTGRKHSVRGVLTEGIKFSSALMIERSASSSRSRMHDFQFAACLQPDRLQRAAAADIKVASRASRSSCHLVRCNDTNASRCGSCAPRRRPPLRRPTRPRGMSGHHAAAAPCQTRRSCDVATDNMQCCNKRQVALQCAILQHATDINHGWCEMRCSRPHAAPCNKQRVRHATSHTRRRTRNHGTRNAYNTAERAQPQRRSTAPTETLCTAAERAAPQAAS
jgi:hypothetical protein